MATARINIKNMDYFKFKKLVVDGSREDYDQCSKEVRGFCDVVQTLRFRDEEFDLVSDIERFQEICNYYKMVLISKRIDSADMCIKSGWWGDHKNAYSAGKLKPTILRDMLLSKAKAWYEKAGTDVDYFNSKIAPLFDACGIYVFKHRDHQCYQLVGRAEKVFSQVKDKMKEAFDGKNREPLSALFLISMCHDWEFYFIPVEKGGEQLLRIKENDTILKHDTLWPYGLNFHLFTETYAELVEFRKSCIRHRWPPCTGSPTLESYDLAKLLAVKIPGVPAGTLKSPTSESLMSTSSSSVSPTEPKAKGDKTKTPRNPASARSKRSETPAAKDTTAEDGENDPSKDANEVDGGDLERTSSESSIVSTSDTPRKPLQERPTTPSKKETRPRSTGKIRPTYGSGRGRGSGEKSKLPVAGRGGQTPR